MTHTLVAPAEVRAFVEQVRQQLRDLPDEVRDDLTDGLEADLAELVAEQGSDALGEPVAYARELRAAAGLERRRRRVRRPSALGLDALLDRVHERWNRVVAALPGGVAGLLEALRPVWWVIRAWVAVELVDHWFGSFPYGWVPTMFGPAGWAVTVLAIVVSVQLGRGVLPLGPLRGLSRRLLLLALNAFALVMLVPVVADLPTGNDVEVAYSNSNVYAPHLAFNGNQVLNVFPYDAAGQPLTGVQLVDQNGHRLSVAGSACQDYWTNGTTKVYSAFPVPSRTQDPDTARCTGPTAITFPLASLPSVTLPASVAAATAAGGPTNPQ